MQIWASVPVPVFTVCMALSRWHSLALYVSSSVKWKCWYFSGKAVMLRDKIYKASGSFLALSRFDLCTFNYRMKCITRKKLLIYFVWFSVCSRPRSPPCLAVPLLLLHLLPCHFPPRFQGRLPLPWRVASLKLQPFLWQQSVDNRFFSS